MKEQAIVEYIRLLWALWGALNVTNWLLLNCRWLLKCNTSRNANPEYAICIEIGPKSETNSENDEALLLLWNMNSMLYRFICLVQKLMFVYVLLGIRFKSLFNHNRCSKPMKYIEIPGKSTNAYEWMARWFDEHHKHPNNLLSLHFDDRASGREQYMRLRATTGTGHRLNSADDIHAAYILKQKQSIKMVQRMHLHQIVKSSRADGWRIVGQRTVRWWFSCSRSCLQI